MRDNCCYAAVLFFSCYCLLPPNDGLTPPNDSLLPPNNGLLPPNNGLLPPNENESSGTHTEMRSQWLSLRAACGLINRRVAKMGIKRKAGSRRMAHFLPAWCECLPQRLCCSPWHSFIGRSFYSLHRCRHELPVFDVINEAPDCRIRNFLGADYVSIFRTLEAVNGILIYPNRFVVDDVA